jgi:hypothetical protein
MKERRTNLMNRLLALTAGIFLSVFLTGSVYAASDGAPGNQPVQQDVKKGKIKPASKTAKSWNELEKKRSDTKNRAAKVRQQELSTNGAK